MWGVEGGRSRESERAAPNQHMQVALKLQSLLRRSSSEMRTERVCACTAIACHNGGGDGGPGWAEDEPIF